MDYTSTRLADEMQVPHSVVVKKVKKYAGGNKGKAGTIYKLANRKRLSIVKLGRLDLGTTSVGKDGVARNDYETIYQFNKADYDACSNDEARYYEKNRVESRARGQAAWNDKSKGLRKRHEDNKKKK